MIKGEDILQRLIAHAIGVVQLCNVLPKNRTATHFNSKNDT
jgi:hypothetical protein